MFPNDLLNQFQINRTEKDLFKRAGKQAPMDASQASLLLLLSQHRRNSSGGQDTF